MHPYFTSTLFQRTVALAIAAVAGAWWLTVPGVMTSSTFVAIFGILAASAWVLKSSVENARPASSMAQSLHDVETAAALKHDRRGLNR
jgi:hypothetical protein